MASDDTPDDNETLNDPDDPGTLRDSREQIAAMPAAPIIVNHVVGLYELAAIHLHAQPPHLEDAALAIDALAAVIHTLDDRLGDDTDVLKQALESIQLAFVQVKAAFVD